eukprot:1157358-Pelagomonas_calceolata.AAC.11
MRNRRKAKPADCHMMASCVSFRLKKRIWMRARGTGARPNLQTGVPYFRATLTTTSGWASRSRGAPLDHAGRHQVRAGLGYTYESSIGEASDVAQKGKSSSGESSAGEVRDQIWHSNVGAC